MEMVYGSKPTTPKKILKYVYPISKLSDIPLLSISACKGVLQPHHWQPQLQSIRCVK